MVSPFVLLCGIFCDPLLELGFSVYAVENLCFKYDAFRMLCLIVSEVFCKKHGKGTAWKEQGGRVAVAFRLRFSQVKIIYLKRS